MIKMQTEDSVYLPVSKRKKRQIMDAKTLARIQWENSTTTKRIADQISRSRYCGIVYEPDGKELKASEKLLLNDLLNFETHIAFVRNSFTSHILELHELNPGIRSIESKNRELQVIMNNRKRLLDELEILLKLMKHPPNQIYSLMRYNFVLYVSEEVIEDFEKFYTTIESVLLERPEKIPNCIETNISRFKGLKEYNDLFLNFLRQFQAGFNRLIRCETIMGKPVEKLEDLKMIQKERDTFFTKAFRLHFFLNFIAIFDFGSQLKILNNYSVITASNIESVLKGTQSYFSTYNNFRRSSQDFLFTAFSKKIIKNHSHSSGSIIETVKRSATTRIPLSRFDQSKKEINFDCEPGDQLRSFLILLAEIIISEQVFIEKFFILAESKRVSLREAAGRRWSFYSTKQNNSQMEPLVTKRLNKYTTKLFSGSQKIVLDILNGYLQSNPFRSVLALNLISQLSQRFVGSGTDYLNRLLLEPIIEDLRMKVNKFQADEREVIEDSAKYLRKRRELLWFVKKSPDFFKVLDSQLKISISDESLLVDDTIIQLHEKILVSLFLTLETVAKGAYSGSAFDPEDKEQLNFYIIMIQNLQYMISKVSVFVSSELKKYVKKLDGKLKEYKNLYTKSIISRPFQGFLDVIETLEAMEKGSKISGSADGLATSKMKTAKYLKDFNGKEVRRGIKVLIERIEKHFSPPDDDEDRNVKEFYHELYMEIVCDAKKEYCNIYKRAALALADTFPSDDNLLHWSMEDVSVGFQK